MLLYQIVTVRGDNASLLQLIEETKQSLPVFKRPFRTSNETYKVFNRVYFSFGLFGRNTLCVISQGYFFRHTRTILGHCLKNVI